jgi:glyoxalase family protein
VNPKEMQMKLEGIHHVTAITADAPQNVDFYARVLGLRLVKKTVNQDDPTVYHLFYADEDGSAGADITFFEYPGARRGRAGAGMVHRVVFRVPDEPALAFWSDRLAAEGIERRREGQSLLFDDPEGLSLELRVVETSDPPLVATSPGIPAEVALQGFDEVRAFTRAPDQSRRFLEDTLGFEPGTESGWEVRGSRRGGHYVYDSAERLGAPGAGTVHHVAFASTQEEHEEWHRRLAEAGARPTPIIDRFYFRSIYFREPSGVLFEIATIGPGFDADEPKESLGERLSLPPDFEHLREQIEPRLTPLPDPRKTAGVPQ